MSYNHMQEGYACQCKHRELFPLTISKHTLAVIRLSR
ncbi:hypothetical protein VPHD480_0305 [Vibrio phage D480]